MCGIAGIVRIHHPTDTGEPVPGPLLAIPEAWLDILDESITHRGPDGQARFRDRAVRDDGTVVDVALVHRRLSIIDHAGGHQPMVHDGERLRPDLTYQPGDGPFLASDRAPGLPLIAVAFNGCVYNHRELRTELSALGHRFETDHSDTETLVHGWRAWGMNLRHELDSMHAVLIWDRTAGVLVDATDETGQKPLPTIDFLPVSGRATARAAASSTAALERLRLAANPDPHQQPGPAPVIRPDRTLDWIRFGAGGRGPTDAGRVELAGSWGTFPISDDPDLEPPTVRGGPELWERWDKALAPGFPERDGSIERAVAAQLEADVPVGVFLSGGLDSALIAAIARRHRDDIRAFTVRMPDARHDESEDAAETARHIGIEHTILDCDPDPAGDLVKLIHQLGLPFGDSSLLPAHWVCRAAGEHVKVSLSGDGGDELFCGYRRHTINPHLTRWRHLLRLIPDRLLDRRTPGSSSEYLARLAVAARHRGYDELRSIFPTPDLLALIRSDGLERHIASIRAVRGVLAHEHDFEHYLPEDLLRKTDTASMAVPIEVRAPFLAREVVMKAQMCAHPSDGHKALLKAFARKYLPDRVIDRPKRGFAIPVGEWFRTDYGGMRQLLRDHLGSTEPFPGLAAAGVEINMKFVRRMLREHDRAGDASLNPWHGRDHSQRLYMLLVLSIWCHWLDDLVQGGGTADETATPGVPAGHRGG